VFRLFDIPFNHFLRHRSRRPNVVSDLPKSAAPEIRLSNLGIPFQQVLARVRLELPSDVRRAVLRVCLHEQVYVVVCNLQGENLVTEVVSSLTKQLSHIVFNYVENRVVVLWTSHEVILAETNRMCMTTVFFHPNPYIYDSLERLSKHG
jgi:hypothetical protein